MKYKVLCNAEHIKNNLHKFQSFFDENDIEITVPEQYKLSEPELLKIIHEYDGAITVADQFTPKVLDAAKKLKVISKWGTGIDSIDSEYAKKKGIKVCYSPNAFTHPVSDSVMGLMLSFARGIHKMDRELKSGVHWEKSPNNYALDELTLGIIGLGNIGQALARKASAFNMNILGNDIIDIPKETLEKHNIQLASKEQIFKECDFISIHVNLTEEAKGMITQLELKKMKPSCVLINTSRGAVINLDDLIEALKNKTISGAALDVFEVEPLPIESPLRKMDNVLLSPHNTNSSKKYWELVHQNTLNNLLKHLNDSN